tara:strand:+ start:1557 stop:1973 length:417 start_codon:yes stop_codon:yes gene_type:complete
MESYKNNVEMRGGLLLDFRINTNQCINIFNTYSPTDYDDLEWSNLTFISEKQETQYWKTFHEEISESLNKKVNGERVDLQNEIYNEMSSLYKNYRQNEWLWVIKDEILFNLDGTKINIIETYGANSDEAEKYRVGDFK